MQSVDCTGARRLIGVAMTCSVCHGSGCTKRYRSVSAYWWPIEFRANGRGFACFHCNGTGDEPPKEYVHVPVFRHAMSADDTVTIEPIDPPATG